MTAQERDDTVARFFPIVHTIAHRVARICRLTDEDDLVGDGALGLVRAVDNYDAGRGPSLDQYIRHMILGAMLNGLRRKDPISERARRKVREGERLRRQREAQGHALSERELEMHVPGFGRASAQVARGLPVSLDAPLPVGLRVRADWNTDPARVYEISARGRSVRRALHTLPQRQREIVVQYYFAERSLRSISEHMAVTPQRVSQLHCAALARLRIDMDADVR